MTTLTQRLRASWNALTATKAPQPKQVLLWPTWKEGVPNWTLTDLSAYVDEGFNLNALIYAAIMYKVRAAASAPLRAYLGNRDQKEPAPPNHPLARLLDRPNRYQSFLELDAELRTYFNLFGNAYVWFERAPGNRGYPLSMHALRPDRVQHLYRDNGLAGFVYVPQGGTYEDGTALLPEDTMHVRLPNPGDPFSGLGAGLSPIAPAAHSGDVDNAATAYLKQFFEFGAMPPGVLSFDVPLQDEDVANARRRWMEVYGGSRNWSDIAVLDSGGKYQRLGLTFSELDMAALDARNESRLAMVFGVPLTLIESRPELVSSTYANKEQDRVLFWQDTMLPELRMFEVEWLYYLRGEDGAFPAYDLGAVPALQAARAARTTRILDAARAGLATRAEYKEAEGLPFDASDEVYLVPIGSLAIPANAPAATTEATRANSETEPGKARATEPTTKARAMSLEAKQQVWKAIDAIATSHEEAAQSAARKAFEHDYREIRAIVSAGQKAALAHKATVAWMDVLIPISDYYKMDASANWRKQFAPVFEALILAQGKQLNATYGMTFDVRNLFGEDWYRSYEMHFSDTLNATSLQEIRDLISIAAAQGATVPEMERSLAALFQQWTTGDVSDWERTLFAEARKPEYRLEMIARTETMRLSNAGANALYKDWGVHEQEWLATSDGRTRESHRVGVAWGHAPLVTAIGSTFEIGGEALRYPGDPAGSPENTINCRCTVLPVIEE